MKEIEVEQFEYKTTKTPNELYSGGVGPCIVIGAIYEGRGYMLHEVPLSYNFSSDVERMFSDLRRDVRNNGKLQIYIVGGEIELNDEAESEIRAGRQSVLDKIARRGFGKCVREVRWCQPNYCQSLRLILSEGRAEIEESDMCDEFFDNDF